jgi:hypothetical protein
MPLITDPDDLTFQLGTSPTGVMLTVDTTNKLVYLRTGGALSTDGVTLKCVYSKLKEIWKTNSTAIKFEFPITPITDEQMEIGGAVGWKFADDTTRNLIRTGGWAEKTGSVTNREYVGVITLGSIGSSDQVYYRQQSTDGAPTNIVLTGAVNQAIQSYGDASNGNFDYRSYLKLYVREQAKTYASSSLTDIGVTTMTYQVYRFPLTNSVDTKVTQDDTTVDSYGVTITWYGSDQVRNIGGTNRNFRVIINGNSRTAEEIYMAVQSLLRKATDIDSGGGTRTGSVTNQLLQFSGDTLITKLDSTGGVFIDNFQVSDTNRLVFVDNTGTERTYPFVSAFRINFGDNLSLDSDSRFTVFFSNADGFSMSGSNFGTSNAIIVNDSTSNPMTDDISGRSFVTLTYDYDGNVQRGATSAGTDVPVTVVGIGLSTGQYVKATGTIARSTSNAVSLVAALERNYANP